MIDEKRIKIAKRSFDRFLKEGLLKREKNETAFQMYLNNADLSLKVAIKLLNDEKLKPYLWVIVSSYYSMFYMANAVLLNMGYRIGKESVHAVTNEALITLVLKNLRKELLSEYGKIMEDVLSISSSKATEIIKSYSNERNKRAIFQYEISEDIKERKAKTSVQRAKEFNFEMRKLLK
ncbi:MAG: HEPN domain-containing protein [Nanoarchaeota archaeon]|jgi:uncharacterized protein (UPF0332 family)|nr:HEPN domain-containing protein [Nanoarchaeota archaeon]